MSQQPLFKLIGEPILVPVTVGYENLTEEQKENIFNQSWCSDDFDNPHAEPFFEFLGSMWSAEMDLAYVNALAILDGSGFEYQFRRGLALYGLRFERDDRGVPVSTVIQEFEKAVMVLPEVLTQEQAGQLVEKLACHTYDLRFDVPPATIKTVVEDLIPWSDMTDTDFEQYTGNRELLEELFHRVRNCKDAALHNLLDEFFSQTIDRTL